MTGKFIGGMHSSGLFQLTGAMYAKINILFNFLRKRIQYIDMCYISTVSFELFRQPLLLGGKYFLLYAGKTGHLGAPSSCWGERKMPPQSYSMHRIQPCCWWHSFLQCTWGSSLVWQGKGRLYTIHNVIVQYQCR